jgi:hypothetical protein
MPDQKHENLQKAKQEVNLEDLPVEESNADEIKAGIRTIALAD